jgi:hypothetical protein
MYATSRSYADFSLLHLLVESALRVSVGRVVKIPNSWALIESKV